MYGSLDISTSGMIAQRTRMQVIAANLANANTLQNTQGEYDPYRRRAAMLAPSGDPGNPQGVRVAEIEIEQSGSVVGLSERWRRAGAREHAS